MLCTLQRKANELSSEDKYTFKRIDTVGEIENVLKCIPDVVDGLEKRISLAEYYQKIANYAENIVLMHDGEMCAFASMYINDQESKIAYLTLFACLSNRRHMGYGSRLFGHMIHSAKEHGMEYFKLEVDKNNVIAISFYQKDNMKIVSETENSYYMQKRIC